MKRRLCREREIFMNIRELQDEILKIKKEKD